MRANNWPKILASFYTERSAMPFAWGTNDCCILTCDWIKVLTGKDPAEELGLRGTYSTTIEAYRVLDAKSGIEELATDYCAANGFPEIQVNQAQRGDIVLIPQNPTPALGVCMGANSFSTGAGGAIKVPTLSCLKAWRIS